ncbi:hypothetical protein HBH70_194550 [Parastagonospora nodorum]|nr:hypothetical protein HBH51_182250 [Parastagonospora nodorum]KAH3968496.1 hypothetical protein HBH52_178890 [Parastagonospora nodorum]KAH4163825.1 hypothetical protein HBH43_155550 [Parastagonospora nodorum]KAH4294020.1 hypothetical protein HBI01_168350 [Parastagonospora nodorum]KAH4296708.1 hypothetical protein HBI02_167180 [Parastagonospora nodorum]
MYLAFYIIRVSHATLVKPTIRRSEVVFSTQQPAISSPDRNYAWATKSTTLPQDPSTHVTFDVAIEKRNGNYINGCEIHWDVHKANTRVTELAVKELKDVMDMGLEYEFECRWRKDETSAAAHLRLPVTKRFVSFQILTMDVDA